jgi:AraC family transcriptional regulator
MRPDALNCFEVRTARVLRLIADHIDEPLSLERLAAEAALSTFHFHRVWRAVTGEPIMNTVRRVKLERAAHLLATTTTSVTQIALATGFESSQSFARAFRQVMGRTPSEVRAAGAYSSATGSRRPSDAAVSVEILTLDPFTIVAKRRTGPYTTADLAATFRVPWEWAQSARMLPLFRGIYGVPLDDPASVPPYEIRYDAGFDFGSGIHPPEGLHLVTLGGGQAARVRVRGSYAGLDAAYDFLYGTWLPSSGREPADAPLFNHFHNDPDTVPEADLVTDVHLPLKPPTPDP